MLILVDKITPRVVYTFDFVFKARGVDYDLTADALEFTGSEQVIKLNYSVNSTDSPSITPATLLIESEVVNYGVSKGEFQSLECLSFNGKVDPIASVFYILTRFEEYFEYETDKHGRYLFKNSVLSKYNWVDKPICDYWANEICSYLGLTINVSTSPEIIPTFDIDNAYAYLHKDKKRQLFSTLKDYTRLDFKRINERKKVLSSGVDPYDTFTKIKEIAIEFPKTKLFWLVESDGKYDRNVRIDHLKIVNLIQDLKSVVEINLHPSYFSDSIVENVGNEKVKLEKITGESITSSRQHFLKLKFPNTYISLMSNGFTHDYTMGFAEKTGFRSGTARNHQWFNLIENCVENLTIHPFVYMDGSLNEYMHLSIEESKKHVLALFNEVKKYGGDFIMVWHNETIGNVGIWNKWIEVLNYTLSLSNE